MANASNQIVKLPTVPARDYSNLFCVFDQVSEKAATAAIKLVTSPCNENHQVSNLSGRSDKTFDIDCRKQSRKQKQYCFALARSLSDAAQGVREEQTRKHSPQSGPGGEVSSLLSSVT